VPETRLGQIGMRRTGSCVVIVDHCQSVRTPTIRPC